MSTDQHVTENPENPRAERDAVLFDRLERLVDRQGVVGAAETLCVNCRTLNRCLEDGRISRRVREAVRKLPEVDGEDGRQPAAETSAQETTAGVEQRLTDTEQAVESLKQAVGRMAGAQADVQARLARLEAARGYEPPKQPTGEQPTGESAPEEWTLPKRAFGMPRPGVVTLEAQDDEAVAFGPAAGLVDEWRELRSRDKDIGSGVGRARAEERRCELEVAMIGEFGLTLPPEKEPTEPLLL